MACGWVMLTVQTVLQNVASTMMWQGSEEQYLQSLPDCFNPFSLPAWAFVVVECECCRELLSVDGTVKRIKDLWKKFSLKFQFYLKSVPVSRTEPSLPKTMPSCWLWPFLIFQQGGSYKSVRKNTFGTLSKVKETPARSSQGSLNSKVWTTPVSTEVTLGWGTNDHWSMFWKTEPIQQWEFEIVAIKTPFS